MRPIERIDYFLNKVDWLKVSERWKITPLDLYKALDVNNYLEYWKENPDQRIGQVLINLNLIPDNFFIWNDEESEILESQGLPPEEYLYWTSYYDKEGHLLDEPIIILIKNLDSDHIIKIYDYVFNKGMRLADLTREAFMNVLKSRNEDLKHIEEIEQIWNTNKKEQL